jgi:hypothetical protein
MGDPSRSGVPHSNQSCPPPFQTRTECPSNSFSQCRHQQRLANDSKAAWKLCACNNASFCWSVNETYWVFIGLFSLAPGPFIQLSTSVKAAAEPGGLVPVPVLTPRAIGFHTEMPLCAPKTTRSTASRPVKIFSQISCKIPKRPIIPLPGPPTPVDATVSATDQTVETRVPPLRSAKIKRGQVSTFDICRGRRDG